MSILAEKCVPIYTLSLVIMNSDSFKINSSFVINHGNFVLVTAYMSSPSERLPPYRSSVLLVNHAASVCMQASRQEWIPFKEETVFCPSMYVLHQL